MLSLDNVTLLGIDTVKPDLTIEAFEFSTRFVKFAEIVLLTDLKKFPHLHKCGINRGPLKEMYTTIRTVHHEESDEKLECPRKEHYPLPKSYEIASMTEPVQHMKTDYILFMEWDAAVLNPLAFDPVWYDYDYIGASWFPHHELGWSPCSTPMVGNAGCSWRSRKYCAATRKMIAAFPEDKLISADMTPCLTRRGWMQDQGVHFAPWEVGKRFSCENSIYAGQWVMHGQWTVEMNGWHGGFFDKRYPKKR